MNTARKCQVTAGKRWLMLIALCGMGSTAAAAPLWTEAGEVDKSEWECKYCLFESGLDGEVRVGVGYVGDDDYNYGNFTGMEEEGAYGVLGVDVYYRGENANYWRLNAQRMGLDSRSLDFEGGRQGTYEVTFDYTEIPRLHSNSALTPYRGVGGEDLSLPAGWVEGGTSDTLTELDDSLRTVELRTDRQRIGAGISFTPGSRWSYSANFKHEHKEGLKPIGGSFLFRGEVLPEPVDYTTDQVELGLGYQADEWHLQLGYLGSYFKNGNDRLRWDNPYIEPVGHANEGQMALPPDNTFHQLMLSGVYHLSDRTQASARLAAGQMLQDEEFLPYTVNPSLTTSALPRDSLEGEVRTLTLDARLVSHLSEKLTLQGNLRYNDRDNQTPVDSFDYVSTDVYLPGERDNRLYHRTDRGIDFVGRYRLTPATRLAAGAEYKERQRPDQEVEETREGTLWAEVASRPNDIAEVVLRVAQADRDASEYQVLDSTEPAQNPLLVKFNMAEREQQRAEAWVYIDPVEHLNIGIQATYRDNDYTDTAVGLTSSRDTVLTLDGVYRVDNDFSVHAFTTREEHENQQAGSQNFAVADWFATSEDIIVSYGLGADWRFMYGDVEIGAEYVFSEATGKIDVRSETGFPELKNNIHSANAHLRYRFTDTMTGEWAVTYERFESEDWMVDDIDPDTIPEVLTLGTESPDYENWSTALVLHYLF